MNYIPVKLDRLSEIQQEVMTLFPLANEKRTVLFYIDNNVSEFLKLPVLRHQLQQADLLEYVSSIAFYNVMPTGARGGAVHIDHGESIYSFNLPIMHCDNTFVNFYSTNNEPEKRFNAAGVPYYHIDESKCQCIDTVEMTQPYIINVKTPHNVVNDNLKNRITLLIRLKQNWNYTDWIKRQSNSQLGSNFS